MDNSQFEQILNHLNMLARLLALPLPETLSQKDKIKILHNMRIQPKDIAIILDTTRNNVSVALSNMKKEKPSKKLEKKDE